MWPTVRRVAFFGAVFASIGIAAAQPVQDATGRIALFQPSSITRSGLREAHVVALTFDDGPNRYTVPVLDALKAMNIKATFFIVGHLAQFHPDILARIAGDGHLLANHSATHTILNSRFDSSPALLIAELRKVHDLIAPLMRPSDKFYFRSPYGLWRSEHAEILNADPVLRNYVGPVYWDEGGDTSVTSDGYVMSAADWSCWRHDLTPEACAKGYLREIRRHDGGVVLLHCIQRQSAALVEAMVPALVEEGYRFVRIDQVPEYRRYETPSTPASVAQNNANARRYAAFFPHAFK